MILILTTFVAACGGDGKADTVLHMRGFDIRASDYQATTRAVLTANKTEFKTSICDPIKGLSDSASITFMRQMSADGTPQVPAGGTPVPNQALDADSSREAIKIIKAECSRAF